MRVIEQDLKFSPPNPAIQLTKVIVPPPLASQDLYLRFMDGELPQQDTEVWVYADRADAIFQKTAPENWLGHKIFSNSPEPQVVQLDTNPSGPPQLVGIGIHLTAHGPLTEPGVVWVSRFITQAAAEQMRRER